MIIDLKYGLPVVMPFILLGIARLLWLMAGAEWSNPTLAAGMCIIMGVPFGSVIVISLIMDDIKWRIKLWSHDQ